jgi:hypothetical protein
MRRTQCLLIALTLAVALFVPQHAGGQAIITNGTVTLGVNAEGHLNVNGGSLSPFQAAAGAPAITGLRLNANNAEGLGNGRPCEGWGLSLAGHRGFANRCFTGAAPGGVSNLTVESFSATGDSVTSVVRIKDAANVDVLRVTHVFHPISFEEFMYQVDVTVENLTAVSLGDGTVSSRDLVYRRVMDWDPDQTVAEEFVTIGGHPALHVAFTSDDGFETPEAGVFQFGAPLDLMQQASGTPCAPPNGFGVDYVRCGRYFEADGFPVMIDHGTLFDIAFPGLGPAGAPNSSRSFTLHYGVAPNGALASRALYNAATEVFSLAQCRPLELDPVGGGVAGGNAACTAAGAPNTFIFGAAAVGGTAVFGDVSGLVFLDVDGNGSFDGTVDTRLGGVTLMLTGTDAGGQPVSQTAVSAADGTYVFATLRAGTYSVTAPTSAGGGSISTANPVSFALARGEYAAVSFGYIKPKAPAATASIAGRVFEDKKKNGRFDAGHDPVLAGVVMSLTGRDVSGASVTRTATTGPDGRYLFGELLAGRYYVAAPDVFEHHPRLTASPASRTLVSGQVVSGVDFAYDKHTCHHDQHHGHGYGHDKHGHGDCEHHEHGHHYGQEKEHARR